MVSSGRLEPVCVDGAAAHELLIVGKRVAELPGHRIQHFGGFRRHLGANSIPGQYNDSCVHVISRLATDEFTKRCGKALHLPFRRIQLIGYPIFLEAVCRTTCHQESFQEDAAYS